MSQVLRRQLGIIRCEDSEFRHLMAPPALFEGLVPARSVIALTGEPYCGKTFLALDMMLCLDREIPLLGCFPPRQQMRTLFIGQDAPPHDYARQIRKLMVGHNLDPEDPTHDIELMLGQSANMLDGDFITSLRSYHAEAGFDVLMLDSFLECHPTLMDENNNALVGGVVRNLKYLRDDLGITVIFVHHLNKPSATSPMSANYRIRGGSAIPAGIDAHIALSRSGHSTFRLELPKNRGDDAPIIERMKMHRNYDDGSVILEGVAPVTNLVRMLLANKEMARSEIIQAMNDSTSMKHIKNKEHAVDNALRVLRAQNLVRHVRHGVYEGGDIQIGKEEA